MERVYWLWYMNCTWICWRSRSAAVRLGSRHWSWQLLVGAPLAMADVQGSSTTHELREAGISCSILAVCILGETPSHLVSLPSAVKFDSVVNGIGWDFLETVILRFNYNFVATISSVGIYSALPKDISRGFQKQIDILFEFQSHFVWATR